MITLHLDESNNVAGEVVTEAITAPLVFGAKDQTGLTPTPWVIYAGTNSFEKWLRVHVTSLGEFTTVQRLKIWAVPSTLSGVTLAFNGHTDQTSYDLVKKTAFSAPTNTATRTPYAVPLSEPASANLGIGGSLTGTLTAPGRSDYLLLQLQVAGSTAAGNPTAIRFFVGYEPLI